jgi:hypothetical protein
MHFNERSGHASVPQLQAHQTPNLPEALSVNYIGTFYSGVFSKKKNIS